MIRQTEPADPDIPKAASILIIAEAIQVHAMENRHVRGVSLD